MGSKSPVKALHGHDVWQALTNPKLCQICGVGRKGGGGTGGGALNLAPTGQVDVTSHSNNRPSTDHAR